MAIPPTDYEDCSNQVSEGFSADGSISYAYTLPLILSQIPVLVYVGQDDDNCNYEGILNYLNVLDWDNVLKFRKASRMPWSFNGEVVGIVKSYDNLTFMIIDKSGHMVPADQPANALEMFRRWIQGIPYIIS